MPPEICLLSMQSGVKLVIFKHRLSITAFHIEFAKNKAAERERIVSITFF
jgi:hypothetical protein